MLQYMGSQRIKHDLVTEQQLLLGTKGRVAKSKESLINGEIKDLNLHNDLNFVYCAFPFYLQQQTSKHTPPLTLTT